MNIHTTDPTDLSQSPAEARLYQADNASYSVDGPSWSTQHQKHYYRKTYLIIGIIIGLVLIVSALPFRSKKDTTLPTAGSNLSGKSFQQPDPSLVNPADSTTPASTSNTSASSSNSDSLNSLLTNFSASQPVPFYIYVKNLSTGETASLRADQSLTSASLYKLYVATLIYRQIDAGRRSLASDQRCLNAMITVSDNACAISFGNQLGWQNQRGNLANLGFSQTAFNSPTTTSARDVGLLYEKLYNGALMSTGSSENFLNLLKAQKINNRLPKGLPVGTTFAHKTGDLWGYMHDAGIVYGPKSNYIVVVMSGPWRNTSQSFSAHGDLSAQLWTYFER